MLAKPFEIDTLEQALQEMLAPGPKAPLSGEP